MKLLILSLLVLSLTAPRAATLEETMRQLTVPQGLPMENLSSLLIGMPGLRESRRMDEVIHSYMQPAMFRTLNGESFDLRALAAQHQVGRFTGVLPVTLAGWEIISGDLIDISSEGALLQVSNRVIYVTGKLSPKPNDGKKTYHNLFLKLNGTHQVYLANGGTMMIPRYDQGQPDEKAYTTAVERLIKEVNALREAEEKRATAKRIIVDERTLAFQKQQAEAGSGQAQYALAIRYLEGKGVERDEKLAVEWLKKSAALDFGPAKRKLEELEKPPTESSTKPKSEN